MKTVKLLATAAAFFFWLAAAAQPATKASMKAMFAQKLPRPKLAADKIQYASIPPLKKPAVAGIDLVAQLQALKDKCPLLLAEKPSLELQGERATNNLVKLRWETTNGWNNRSFLLERSLGDTLHFETVRHVWAKQIAGMRDRYHQPDDNEYNRISYYRLKLLLYNGDILSSNTVKVNGYDVESLRLFPNPANQKVVVRLSTEAKGIAAIALYDAAGKKVLEQTGFIVSPGENEKEIQLAGLAGGAYSLKVVLPDKSERSTRLIKQ